MDLTLDEMDLLDQILWDELRRADTMVADYYEAVFDVREKIMKGKYT